MNSLYDVFYLYIIYNMLSIDTWKSRLAQTHTSDDINAVLNTHKREA